MRLDQYCPGAERPVAVETIYPAHMTIPDAAATYYVDAIRGEGVYRYSHLSRSHDGIRLGNNENSGDIEHPFLTVQRGLDAAAGQPGAIVALRYVLGAGLLPVPTRPSAVNFPECSKTGNTSLESHSERILNVTSLKNTCWDLLCCGSFSVSHSSTAWTSTDEALSSSTRPSWRTKSTAVCQSSTTTGKRSVPTSLIES